ncbi:MAG: hypothetical protein IJY75_05945 [Bacteroidaceae bacterium]|nr:hypothetical protein [Bacteroidaceae bacterium]
MKIGIRQLFDRWLHGTWWIKIIIILGIALSIFFVSATILIIIDDKTEFDKENWWRLYYYFSDPGVQAELMTNNNLPKYVGLIMSTLGAIFLSGLLISTITNMFERKSDKWRMGFSYYKLEDHIVIIGSDQMVHGLVNQLCEEQNNNIVVMTSADVEQMRNSLHASLKNKKDKKRIIVNYGQRDSENYLSKINIAHAKEVYILGDTSEFDDIESFHDSLNVQCVTLIANQCKRCGRKGLPCHVLFDYKTTYHVFQYADLGPEITEHIDFHPFNFYDFWARKVFVVGASKNEDITYKPLDYIPITDRESNKYVHLIVLGMSKMGQAMALQAAHIAHFPNYRKRKTKITFIDRNGKVEMGEFKQKCGELFKVSRSTYIDADAWAEAEERRIDGEAPIEKERYITTTGLVDEYKHLVEEGDTDKDFIDIEWQFIKGDDHNPIVQELLKQYAKDDDAMITVAICLNLTHISLRSAMYLPKEYYEKDIPILVQQRKTSTIASTLNGKGFDKEKRKKLLYKNITPFGMVYDCYDLHIVSSVETCKRISSVYDYYFKNGTTPTYIKPEEADEVWKSKIITKRWSNIFAAASIPTKLRCIGSKWSINNNCFLENLTNDQIELLAEIEHNRWNVEELLLGYRPVKKEEDNDIFANRSKKQEYKEKFIHYDIRPYNGLKEDEKGNLASVYDMVIVKSLPLILNHPQTTMNNDKS